MRPALIFGVFALFALLPLLLAFVQMWRWGLAVHVWVDPEDPSAEEIAGYLAEIARRLDERPERMRIVFEGRNRERRGISLDLRADRCLVVHVDGQRPKAVDLRARWIADHPVPLDLHHAVLYVEPVDANRFRVISALPFALPLVVYVACSLVATVGLVLLIPELVAAALGLPFGVLLVKPLRHMENAFTVWGRRADR